MEWFKKHTDTVLILGSILSCVFWMNGRFNQIEEDILVIKTVMVMKGIMPTDLASQDSS